MGGLMPNQPDRLKRCGIAGQPWNHVPMNVRDLVAEQLVIDLPGLKDVGEGFGDEVHFLHQVDAFGRSQVKELGRVTLEDDHRPTRKELIVMEIGIRQAEVC